MKENPTNKMKRKGSNNRLMAINQLLLLILLSVSILGCKKYVEVTSLSDKLLASQVFSTDASANSAVAGMYRLLRTNLYNGGSYTPAILTGLSSDELYNFFPSSVLDDYKNNNIQITNGSLPWSNLYKIIYSANAIIEGLEGSSSISQSSKNQFTGEAKFVRAFCYFYLINLFGDVPFLSSTEVTTNSTASRNLATQVYNQIINDLLDAQELLDNGYLNSGGERIRVNKAGAIALLARVYLYNQNWSNAELQASAVINSGLYVLLTNIDSFAIKNNNEAILQWANTSSEGNYEPTQFIFTTSPNILCSNSLLTSFESGDLRKTKWIKSGIYSGNTYYYPYKYKSNATANVNEYYTVLRLAEQYLIRAEALAKQNKINVAVADLNIIRQRAGLPSISVNISQDSCLNAIMHERQIELFAEGHRWFDLKRTGRINVVLGALKGNNWQTTDTLFPIPLSDIQKDPNLTQNQGY